MVQVIVRQLGPRPHPRIGADHDRGAVALVVAALMVVFMGLAALIVDLGFARDREGTAQSAADAAALAVATCFASATSGCNSVPAATAKAQAYITANGWTFDASTVSIDTAGKSATITLPAQQTPSFFAGALGARNPSIARSAKATWVNSGPVTCVLCVLQDFQGHEGDITLGGGLAVGGDLTFENGQGSVTINGSGTVNYGGQLIGGSFTVNGSPTTPLPLSAPLTDPYAGLILPPVGFRTRAVAGSGACAPDTYTDLSGCTSLTGSGTYVVTGAGSGDTPVTLPAGDAPDTLIYFTCGRRSFGGVRYQPCSQTSRGAHLAGAANGTATIEGRTRGLYQGFAVIYDPSRNVGQTLTGNGSLVLDGNVYARSVLMDFRGNGSASITVAGTVVARGVALNGGGAQNQQLAVPGSGSPPIVAPGRPIHLIP